MDLNLDVFAQNVLLGALEGKTIQDRQRIGRNSRPDPLNDIAVVVVMRRLDQHEAESFLKFRFHHAVKVS